MVSRFPFGIIPFWGRTPRLWAGSWWKHAAKMVRVDLKAAGIPFADADGRVFDFHAMRGQFISNLEAAGVTLKMQAITAA